MKVNTIAVEYNRKFNLGNWESVTIGVTMWAAVDEDEDPEGVTLHMFEEAKKQVKNNIPASYTPFKAVTTVK